MLPIGRGSNVHGENDWIANSLTKLRMYGSKAMSFRNETRRSIVVDAV
jgi:hypothetical protein